MTRENKDVGMEKLLTLEEAAEVLKVSPQTVRTWVAVGKIRAVKLGKLVRVRPADLEAFIHDALVPKEAEK
jgi:excisionase family DNA binding protein